MYCKMVLKSGATLTELKNDLVGLLTNTIIDKANLTSVDVAATELVIVEAAEWTFVQDLADTATRKHFVLEGVDDGGIKKTLGFIMEDKAGILNFQFWVCGPWNPVTKRPAAIDPSGFALSNVAAAAQFEEGGTYNTVYFLGMTGGSSATSAFTAAGALADGSVQLVVGSVQGNTSIYSHYATTHLPILRLYDIDRGALGDLTSPVEWPFVLIAPFIGAVESIGNPGPNFWANSSDPAARGLCLGWTPNGYSDVGALLKSELGFVYAFGVSQTGGAREVLHRASVNAACMAAAPQKGNNLLDAYLIGQHECSLSLGFAAFYLSTVRPQSPVRRAAPAYKQRRNAYSNYDLLPYLDEIVTPDGTYVAQGATSMQYYAVFKG